MPMIVDRLDRRDPKSPSPSPSKNPIPTHMCELFLGLWSKLSSAWRSIDLDNGDTSAETPQLHNLWLMMRHIC